MITRITGIINRVLDEEIRMQVGQLEYQVMVPECVRRQLQTHNSEEVTLHTSEYLEGNPTGSKMIPRLIGFANEAELEFFDLFCTVEKIGVKKALKALARPIREIADAIQRQDAKWLTTLPGIGPATAEQIIATLRRKVVKFALMPAPAEGGATGTAELASAGHADVLADAYTALISIGVNPGEARDLIDKAATSGKKFAGVDEVLLTIYQRK
jgi:Holliday junction DNA helicase RuvA